MVKASTLHSTCHALSRRSAVASNPAFPPNEPRQLEYVGVGDWNAREHHCVDRTSVRPYGKITTAPIPRSGQFSSTAGRVNRLWRQRSGRGDQRSGPSQGADGTPSPVYFRRRGGHGWNRGQREHPPARSRPALEPGCCPDALGSRGARSRAARHRCRLPRLPRRPPSRLLASTDPRRGLLRARRGEHIPR